MLFGVNMFWALLSAHFSPRYARAKMSLSRAQNIFTPLNINYIVILFCFKSCWQFLIIWSYLVFKVEVDLYDQSWMYSRSIFEVTSVNYSGRSDILFLGMK